MAFLSALPDGTRVGPSGPYVRLEKCKLRVALGKAHTLYEARCRAALFQNDVVLVAVEARAYRRARSTALAKGTRAEKDGKNPYIDDGHVKEVLLAAARTAGKMILDKDLRPAPLDENAAVLEGNVQRNLALQNLSAADAPSRTGAAIDLGTFGSAEDAARIEPLLDDNDPLVRRAAVVALAEMAVPAQFTALASRCAWGPSSQQKACEKGLLRMQAQSPSLRTQNRPPPLLEPKDAQSRPSSLMRRGFFEKQNAKQTMEKRSVIGEAIADEKPADNKDDGTTSTDANSDDDGTNSDDDGTNSDAANSDAANSDGTNSDAANSDGPNSDDDGTISDAANSDAAKNTQKTDAAKNTQKTDAANSDVPNSDGPHSDEHNLVD